MRASSSTNATLASTANTATESVTGATVTVFAGDSGLLLGETFTTGSAGDYNTTSWTCDGFDTNPEDGLDIVAADDGNTITCQITKPGQKGVV